MRIAVDARELVGRPTGVGRYLSELLAEWRDHTEARRHEWYLYAHRPPAVVADAGLTVRVVPGHGGTVWEQWTLARALAANPPDVLFAPGYTAPFTAPCPTVLTIHDVSFAAHPEWFSPREGRRRRLVSRWSARRARVVVTDTEFSRGEIVRHLGIPAARVRVIPLGVRRVTSGGATDDTAPRPARESMVLFVGSIFRRRHVDQLIVAFSEKVATSVPGSRLEIVGENRSHPALNVAALLAGLPAGIRERIAVRSYVDDATLADLYARAAVFAFPSEYEGFGLTPLEALAHGVPPVVLDTPVAREVYGQAARYSPQAPDLTARLGDALVELLTSASAREDVLRHAPEILSRYRWDRTAEATLNALREAVGA